MFKTANLLFYLQNMKRLFFLVMLLISVLSSRAQNYVIFLHNMYTELYPLDSVHPQYGRCEYPEIVEAFRKEGLIVISEKRPKGTDGTLYAKKVAHQVDSLIKQGIKSSHITIIGTSKGGYIAQVTSELVKNTEVNYVFVACCDGEEKMHYYGNILSIYESSDKWGTCKTSVTKSGHDVKHFKEIKLNTGKKHGFLYHPMEEWIKPAAQWAKQNYK